MERQITRTSQNHLLTNVNCFSPDGQRIVYDIRSDAEGSVFDGTRIESVEVATGEVRVLYESRHGAHCGIVTYSPVEEKVVFIEGPECPTVDFSYGFSRRRGVVVETVKPGMGWGLDARDLVAPYTAGALRGGTHVHVFSPDGAWLSFTYNDQVLSRNTDEADGREVDLRNVAVAAPYGPVHVPLTHVRNHDGSHFCVAVTRTVAQPKPGSDDIKKACEEGWIGKQGYRRADGGWQRRALAFLGDTVADDGRTIIEVFIVDLPDDVRHAGNGPLQGTETTRLNPPQGTAQRRLTFTGARKYPGVQGPRHWVRSSPDGERLAFLMKDDDGVVQLWTVSVRGGDPLQVTQGRLGVESAFTWSPDGQRLAAVMDGSVCVVEIETGNVRRLTEKCADETKPQAKACVFSPDGASIAYLRRISGMNQIFVCDAS